MNMPAVLLSTNASPALLAALPLSIDAVEVGPWFSPEQIRAYRARLPELPFHFHAADRIEDIGLAPGWTEWFHEYLAATDSPWVSVHVSVWNPGDVARLKQGEAVPLPDPEQSCRALIAKVRRLQAALPVPVWIENVEPLPLPGYDFWAQPDFIRAVIAQTGCGFLFDTGHARISAERLNLDLECYLQALPLDHLAQVHVSGPRRVEGRLEDVHESLEEVDYALLEYVLAHFQPRVVTLEYIRAAGALREQLLRLRRSVGGSRIDAD